MKILLLLPYKLIDTYRYILLTNMISSIWVSKSYNYLYHIYHIIYFIIISNKYICTIQIIYYYSSAPVEVPTTVLVGGGGGGGGGGVAVHDKPPVTDEKRTN